MGRAHDLGGGHSQMQGWIQLFKHHILKFASPLGFTLPFFFLFSLYKWSKSYIKAGALVNTCLGFLRLIFSVGKFWVLAKFRLELLLSFGVINLEVQILV
jgi:hypothetical protein